MWTEYEAGATEEAKLLKDLDKVEMVLQALEYEERSREAEGSQGDLDLSEFFQSVRGKLKTEVGISWAEEIDRRRRESSGNREGNTI